MALAHVLLDKQSALKVAGDIRALADKIAG